MMFRQVGHRRLLFARAEPYPCDAAEFARLVLARAHVLAEVLAHAGVCVGHIDDIAFRIETPAVINALQPFGLVARECQRCEAVRAGFVEHADFALRIAEQHIVLAKHAKAERLAAGFECIGGCGWHPVMLAQHLAERRVAFDAGNEIVFFGRNGHGVLPLRSALARISVPRAISRIRA